MSNNTNDIPVEILSLVRFMCQTWHDVDSWVMSEILPLDAIGQYPVIQGSRNRRDLAAIAKQPFSNKDLRIAVDWMLKNSDAGKPLDD